MFFYELLNYRNILTQTSQSVPRITNGCKFTRIKETNFFKSPLPTPELTGIAGSHEVGLLIGATTAVRNHVVQGCAEGSKRAVFISVARAPSGNFWHQPM